MDAFQFGLNEVRRIAQAVRGKESEPVARSGQAPSPQPAPPPRRVTEVYVTSATATSGLYPGVQVARVQAAYNDPQAPILSTTYPPGYTLPGAAVGSYQPYGSGAADCWVSVPSGTAPSVGDVYNGILSGLDSSTGLPIYTATAPGLGGGSPGSVPLSSLPPGTVNQVLATLPIGVAWGGSFTRIVAGTGTYSPSASTLHLSTILLDPNAGNTTIQLPSAQSCGAGCTLYIANYNTPANGVTTLWAYNHTLGAGDYFFEVLYDPSQASPITVAQTWQLYGGELLMLEAGQDASGNWGWHTVGHYSPYAMGLRGYPLALATPTTGQALVFNGTTWGPGLPTAGRSWQSFTLQAGVDFTAAALTQTVTIQTFNPKTIVTGWVFNVTVPFTGGGTTAATGQIGDSHGGVSTIMAAQSANFASTNPPSTAAAAFKLLSWSAATGVTVTLTTSGANISALTQGTMIVSVETSTVP